MHVGSSVDECFAHRTTTELTTSFANNISTLLHLGNGNHVVEYLIRAVRTLNHTIVLYLLWGCHCEVSGTVIPVRIKYRQDHAESLWRFTFNDLSSEESFGILSSSMSPWPFTFKT